MPRNTLVLAGLASILPVCGVACAGGAAERRVDVGGYVLHARVLGAGSPTVVFEAGLGGPIESWGDLPAAIASVTRVVVYDRAGLGDSDPSPRPRTAAQVARELHALLEGLGEAPPYVQVGHSIGGLYIRVFADLYPDDVAGFVLLDPTTEEMRPRLDSEDDRRAFEAQMEGLPPAIRAELQALPHCVAELGRIGPPPDCPAVVITSMARAPIPEHEREQTAAAGKTGDTTTAMLDRAFVLHRDLAARFSKGRHVVATESGHYIHIDQPDLVRDEILGLLRAIGATDHGSVE